MPRPAGVYARITPHLVRRTDCTRATRAHAWVVRRTGGRLGARALGADILVLRTLGRRTGEQRDAPMLFLRWGSGFVVVASNAASERRPAWWLNLQAQPEAEALVGGRTYAIRARAATESEVGELWPQIVELYSGYEYYKSIATRELPVVVLEPR